MLIRIGAPPKRAPFSASRACFAIIASSVLTKQNVPFITTSLTCTYGEKRAIISGCVVCGPYPLRCRFPSELFWVPRYPAVFVVSPCQLLLFPYGPWLVKTGPYL